MDLSPRSGSERKGRRPCIVISHDAFSANRRWQSLTVVPLTSSQRWRKASPTTVLFQKGECGFPKDCAALAHQVTTLDRSKIVHPRIGRLTAEKLQELEQALRNYLAL